MRRFFGLDQNGVRHCCAKHPSGRSGNGPRPRFEPGRILAARRSKLERSRRSHTRVVKVRSDSQIRGGGLALSQSSGRSSDGLKRDLRTPLMLTASGERAKVQNEILDAKHDATRSGIRVIRRAGERPPAPAGRLPEGAGAINLSHPRPAKRPSPPVPPFTWLIRPIVAAGMDGGQSSGLIVVVWGRGGFLREK